MALSRVMASRSPPNPDLPRRPSPSPLNLQSEQSRGFGSMNMEDILRNIYADSDTFPGENNGCDAGGGSPAVESGEGLRNGNKTVDEVWRDMISGDAPVGGSGQPGMTLEDFLTKAGAVNEDDVRVPAVASMAPPPHPVGGFGMETAMMSTPAAGIPAVQFAPTVCVQNGMTAGGFGMDFGNGVVALSGGGGGGRGKRRATVEEVPLDKATQQKQRRMIKNRESAARSRERKQAYTVELESLVTQLEEENARLLREEAALRKERYKQLMENLIPFVEKRRPPRVLRRVHSMEW